jgi:hypothetical protein
VFAAALVILFGIATQLSTPAILMIMPIAIFEMIFAGWLIVKGFNPAAIALESAKMATDELLGASWIGNTGRAWVLPTPSHKAFVPSSRIATHQKTRKFLK